MEPKVLCVIPALPSDRPTECLHSIAAQTVPVAKTVVLNQQGHGATLQEKLSNVLNEGLTRENLGNYDYLLRVDCDTVLPTGFLASNLALNADVVGHGHAHLIRVVPFMDAMHGQFNGESDETYLNFKFMQQGYKWSYWDVKPVLKRRAGKTHSLQYFLNRGREMWRNGYEPLHVLGSCRWELRNLLCVFGYFAALLSGVPRLDVAAYTFRYQLHKLQGDLTRKQRW